MLIFGASIQKINNEIGLKKKHQRNLMSFVTLLPLVEHLKLQNILDYLLILVVGGGGVRRYGS